ncbi:cyclohexanecarboxylate-CoA ligase [Alicycliphilus denitrificans]|uniref:AMP-binding protein n=1 Tax=Alicycliphilus denitrificans TaxID=179636 RepID=UPI000968F02B|nr:AMP-binding protein [Alicycliphilus denitrificans]MBN9576000.1 AMP-binding protein [Alicycliphilus denitrificans]OJW89092.1 MAG: cyclohexanecarboxylate-CoA ligase [Alicycliphilus sp. 69-12]BCN40872.1 cyclohexanecarboxylate-CoA ligase [Alicycliphilus denitrificans]
MDTLVWSRCVRSAAADAYRASGAWMGRTTADFAEQRARQTPQQIAVVEGGRRLTYAFLLDEARRIAAGLRDLGLRPGDVISFQLPNWWESVVVNLAASLGGWAVNPIVPIYRDAEVGFILADCGAKVIFVPEQFRSIDYVDMLRRIAVDGTARPLIVTVRGQEESPDALRYETLGRASATWEGHAATPDSLKLVLYTSGTTGRPKGVLHSYNTLMSELRAITEFWNVGEQDVVIMPSPVTHITGYSYALEYVFFAGIKVVLMDRWDAAQAVALIQAEQASLTVGATPFLAELTAAVEKSGARLPSFRLFASGGAPVPPNLVLRASRAMPGCLVCRVYGSSESPTVTLGINDAADQDRAAITDGKVCNNEVCIADPVTGESLPAGVEGEILVRGPEVMLCYSREEDTRDAFDADGFFRTGDLGTLSQDGFITVTGRKKDLIIRGGENLSPKEVEDLLHAHPDVLEAAVVAMPHARLGETPCAYVVLKPGCGMDLAQMSSYLDSKRLARQKFPEQLFVVDAMPKTASGKVLKHVLRARLANAAKGAA